MGRSVGAAVVVVVVDDGDRRHRPSRGATAERRHGTRRARIVGKRSVAVVALAIAVCARRTAAHVGPKLWQFSAGTSFAPFSVDASDPGIYSDIVALIPGPFPFSSRQQIRSARQYSSHTPRSPKKSSTNRPLKRRNHHLPILCHHRQRQCPWLWLNQTMQT